MINKKFYINIIVRILLIIGISIIMAINLFEYEKLFTVLACGIGLFILGYDLLRYTNKMNRDLLSFFEALKYEDHSFGLKKMNVPGFQKMSAYMKELNDQLSSIKIENEVQAGYLDSIVEHIQVGLLAAHPSGKIEFFNTAAQKILHIHKINDLNTIRKKYPVFGTILKNLKPGAQKLVTLYTDQGTKHLAVRATAFRSNQGVLNLFSFQNVEAEVEETEIETWKKLIRVLTHEINNSITPIYSLSDSLKKRIEEKQSNPDSSQANDKVKEGLEIIQQRSFNLLEFVEKFRSLTPKGNLKKEHFSVQELFYRLKILMPEFSTAITKIQIVSKVIPENLELYADRKYIEQVLINLIKNAIEASYDNPEPLIKLRAFRENGNTMLYITDNGKGISNDETDKIFIPFYTTKKTGSGIGLSLSRQIMKMHNGNISIHSEKGKGTRIILKF